MLNGTALVSGEAGAYSLHKSDAKFTLTAMGTPARGPTESLPPNCSAVSIASACEHHASSDEC